MKLLSAIPGAVAALLICVAADLRAQGPDTAGGSDGNRQASEQAARSPDERQARADAESDVDATDNVRSRRSDLVREADAALQQLRSQDEEAADLIDQAFGHAVFNAHKGGLIVTGGGGTGVVRRSDDAEEPVFMHLGSVGLALGGGYENYRLVLLLEDEQAYRYFVSGQWDGSLSAQASAGGAGVSAEEPFLGSVRAYRVTERGVMAQVDATGTRFWVSRRLNEEGTRERVAAAQEQMERQEVEEQIATGDDDRVIR